MSFWGGNAAIIAIARAIPVLIQPGRFHHVKANLDGLAFPKKNYYVFFYTEKEMRETLLDIITNHMGEDSANLITGTQIEGVMHSSIWLSAPISAAMDTGLTRRIPLFYTYTVPGNADLHKRTHNQNGEIHGIAVAFGDRWAQDPKQATDECGQRKCSPQMK